MKKIIVIILLILINIPFCFAQIGYNEKEYFLNGKEDFKNAKYRSALYYFEEIKTENNLNQDAKYYAAICKLHLHLQEQALRELKAVDTNHLKENTHYLYWLAEAYFLNEEFGHALKILKIYAEHNEKGRIETYDRLLSHLKTALELYERPENYIVRNMGQHVNSPFHDFGVSKMPFSDNLIYSSNRLTFKEKITDRYDTEILTLYNAKIEKEGTVKEIEQWNKSESLDAQFSVLQILKYEFTSSDKTFLISQNGDLKTLKREKGVWQTPQLFSQRLSEEKGIQEYACLSKDKNILVFASDYKSKGNYELFVSRRESTKNDFEKPVLLDKINSKSNEVTPFLDKNNTLYFSSNRENSAGGFDIFKAEFDTASKEWTEPLILPYPINSVADELYFSIDNSNNQRNQLGYFVSNRINGQGGDDIYEVFFFDSVEVKGQFRERTIKQNPVQNADISFKSTNYAIDSAIFQTKTDEDGNYKINIPINLKSKVKEEKQVNSNYEIQKKKETVFDIEISYQNKLAYQDQISLNPYLLAQRNFKNYVINAYLYVEEEEVYQNENQSKNIKLLQKLVDNLAINKGKSITLRNIYFENGNAILKTESYQMLEELATFLNENQSLNLEIIGHTDNVGSASQNLILSKERAQSVIDFLVNKGVEKTRLKANGYGQERPIASNDDEKEGRELNRRIEVRVLE
ncbi:outer membrane protein/peptidoglycan-associated (lipo)protein [Bernardetia litoralis DSM 6794]|uniref:Outer membrane protein/peptidoglycan-associated (Lipo)protein n=1 Tax=Bernardetia litoralis (strain ATCC 23117 / DSM 6794 / NBRC 15988 / NCIMB 1366 / Fx l1 / Sio-4) TaxID=880071 RepID=I4AKW3_BERLS|nr:OmpA family protein [Bernardetia litoralis]AFM04598.1 outer membrane protein/peptidoglycan-associated (lipo)protein [Bernardetia litoralis DSM 6794]